MRGLLLGVALFALAAPARAGDVLDAIQAAVSANDFDKAVSLSNQALVDPKLTNEQIAGVRGERGIAYIFMGKDREGVDDLTFVLDSTTRSKDEDKAGLAAIYVLRGIGYRGLGDFNAAFADFKTAMATDPTAAEPYEASGDAYYAQGKTDEAIASYSDAISRDPKDADAFVNRGENYENKGVLDQAQADYSAAIAIQPDYAMAYNDRGTVFDRVGKLADAKADYDKAISLDASEPLYLRNRAALHNKRAEWQAAVDDLNKALALDNDDDSKKVIDDIMNTAKAGLAGKPQ